MTNFGIYLLVFSKAEWGKGQATIVLLQMARVPLICVLLFWLVCLFFKAVSPEASAGLELAMQPTFKMNF